MSEIKPNPSDYDGRVTQEQIDQLEAKRVAFSHALATGSADLDDLREDYQNFAIQLNIDLSGKLMPKETPVPDTEPPKPSEGTVKDWGGNQDPDSWKVVHMKNPPEKFKVVDGTGKNIAADFTTEANATAYIVYAIWHKYHDNPPSPPPGPGPSGGDKDKFGILCIKASAPSGKFETAFKLEEKMRNYASGKKSEWSTEYTNESPAIIQNVEVTIYEQIRGFKSNEADTISLKLNGPPHKDGAKFWIIPDFATDGNPKRTLEVEDPHPNNKSINPKPLSEIGGSIIGKWIGYKGISYQKDGKRFVESWIHFPVSDIENITAEQDKWRQYLPTTDLCSKYLTATGKLTTSRLDGVKKGDPPLYKYASVREIQV